MRVQRVTEVVTAANRKKIEFSHLCVFFAASVGPGVCLSSTIRMRLNKAPRKLDEIQDLLDQWVKWDILTSLASYHSVVEVLFGLLKEQKARTVYIYNNDLSSIYVPCRTHLQTLTP